MARSTRYVLVYNTESEPVSVKVSQEGAGRACELDLSRGRVNAVDHDVRGERTNLSVELAP